jgi:hypothetical protein
LVDSFWHWFILSLVSGDYYTLKAIKKAGGLISCFVFGELVMKVAVC